MEQLPPCSGRERTRYQPGASASAPSLSPAYPAAVAATPAKNGRKSESGGGGGQRGLASAAERERERERESGGEADGAAVGLRFLR